MSAGFNIYMCNTCAREFDKYNQKQQGQIYGIEHKRTGTYSLKLLFVDPDKTTLNKHLCSYCIADVLNEFEP